MTKRYYMEIPSKVFDESSTDSVIEKTDIDPHNVVTPPKSKVTEDSSEIPNPPFAHIDGYAAEGGIANEPVSKIAGWNPFGSLFDSNTNKIFGILAIDDIILLTLVFLFLTDILNDDILLLIFAAIFILGL